MVDRKAVNPSLSARFLVDTDWIIDALNGVPAAINAIDGIALSGVGVSIISLGELYDGAFRPTDNGQRLAALKTYLSRFVLSNLSDDIMERFARLRVELRRSGMLIPDFDLLIAATALANEQTLLTRNVRHFQRIPELKIYLEPSS